MAMSDKPSLSAVIPLYNKRDTIERAVRSVLDQSHQDFDFVVIDDGSTDGGAELLAGISDSRMRVISQPNAGVSAARNRGIAETKGDYICFLDADDEWKPTHLSQIAYLISLIPDAGMFSSRYEIVTQQGETIVRALSFPETFRGELRDFFGSYHRSRSLVNSSSVCLRRDCIEEIGGFPTGQPVGEDVYVWLRMAEKYRFLIDTTVSVTIHQDAANRTEDRFNVTVPYFLRYYLCDRDPRTLPESLQKLLVSFTMIYAASSVDRGNRSLPLRYAQMIRPLSLKASALCLALAFVPKGIMGELRRRRYKKATAQSA
jgi:glycosyltransferase involved in cell wall biosynthesis